MIAGEHKILSKIEGISDFKEVEIKDYKRLAAEIRGFLVANIAKTGGHLASNLGVVELTMALHKVFDTPTDKIIWDVGHQSYVHKILTGRKSKFNTLRQLDGLAGFPKPTESPHDAFGTGHSSTSISAALGMAIGRDKRQEKHHVVAVIGDGAITSGLAYEGLNNAGFSKSPMIIIFNDNEMSISENVGGLSKHINKVRYTSAYLEAKKEVKSRLDHVPILGKPMTKLMKKIKESAYQLWVPDDFFKGLNIHYYGPVDGHDTEALIEVLENLKNVKEPVVLHVKTVKGKGYKPAEENPEIFHGVGNFRITDGKQASLVAEKTYAQIFGETMEKMASKHPEIMAITAAMPDGVGLSEFSKKFKDQFIDVGIAEAHSITMAAGLSLSGFKPYVALYSTFLQRAYDQLLHDISIQEIPIVIAVDRAGLVGADGETHHGLFDFAMLLPMPHIEVLAPRDGEELKAMLEMSINRDNPVAIRYPRGSAAGVLRYPYTKTPWGTGEILENGDGKLVIVSTGAMLQAAVVFLEHLKASGFDPMLIHMGYLKETDWLFSHTPACVEYVVLEEHMKTGGFGAYIKSKTEKPVFSVGIPDEFVSHGSRQELLDRHGLTGEKIFVSYLTHLENNKGEGL